MSNCMFRSPREDVVQNTSPIFFEAKQQRKPSSNSDVAPSGEAGLLADYFNNSTVHGVRYIFEKKRHWSERLWWLISFMASLMACGYLIYQVYQKWNETPVIVSFSEKSTHIWEIPFPAVTICPETKTHKKTFNYAETFNKMKKTNLLPPFEVSDEELNRFQVLGEVCNYIGSYELTEHENYTTNIVEDLRMMAPDLNASMLDCTFRNKKALCDDWFEEVITEVGQCYTFNSLNSSEFYRSGSNDYFIENNGRSVKHWHPDKGYDDSHSDYDPYPFRVLGPGAQNGLKIRLHQFLEDLDYTCRFPVQGFRFMLHVPGEFPQMSQYYSRIPLDQELLVIVKPNMITTSNGLLQYSPTRRQCFYNTDRQLKFFQVYTQRNCQLECLANATLSQCGCVRLGFPRDSDTPICGQSKFKCYDKVKDNLLHNDARKKHSQSDSCDCLPACTSITYDAEISQAAANWEETYVSLFNQSNITKIVSRSQLTIYFKDVLFTTSRRSELFGYSDFVANCGGLLGLFMGVSLLSLVEIIYFCTLRVFCSWRKRHQLVNPVHRHADTVRVSVVTK